MLHAYPPHTTTPKTPLASLPSRVSAHIVNQNRVFRCAGRVFPVCACESGCRLWMRMTRDSQVYQWRGELPCSGVLLCMGAGSCECGFSSCPVKFRNGSCFCRVPDGVVCVPSVSSHRLRNGLPVPVLVRLRSSCESESPANRVSCAHGMDGVRVIFFLGCGMRRFGVIPNRDVRNPFRGASFRIGMYVSAQAARRKHVVSACGCVVGHPFVFSRIREWCVRTGIEAE